MLRAYRGVHTICHEAIYIYISMEKTSKNSADRPYYTSYLWLDLDVREKLYSSHHSWRGVGGGKKERNAVQKGQRFYDGASGSIVQLTTRVKLKWTLWARKVANLNQGWRKQTLSNCHELQGAAVHLRSMDLCSTDHTTTESSSSGPLPRGKLKGLTAWDDQRQLMSLQAPLRNRHGDKTGGFFFFFCSLWWFLFQKKIGICTRKENRIKARVEIWEG